ncbi:MAG: DUF2207 domain-containing protein, partial [Clostridia bacterium]|nr:DUF2207 domain-containing protein [Clostridia bacterium]
VYSDIAEFNRKLIGTKWDVPIQNVTAEVVLPEKTSSDRVYVFSHGPLTGESALRDGGTTEFRVDRVPMGEFFEAHVLFPIEIVPEAEHKEARAVLQSILDQEKQLAEEANASRDKAKKDLASAQLRRTVGIRLLPVFFVFWLLGLIWNYKRFGRPPKGTFDGRYFREIPDDYAPTDLYYLMNHEGSPTFKEISATLMDLVRRNLLKLEMKSYLKKGFLRTSAETDFMFSQPEEGIDKTSITETEWFLVDWLFSEAGNGNEFSLQDMKDYFSSMRSGDGAEQKIRAWQKSARDQARQGGFFVERTGKYIFSGIAPALILIISGLVLTFFFTFWGVILFVLAFLSLIHFGRQKHFTPYGWDQYMKWKAFKRFIRDFSRIEDAVIPSIAIWEHYLVFGITLGVAKKVIQAFPKQLYRENVQNYTTSTYVLTRALASSEGNIDSLESHFHEFNNHMEEVAKVANSHSSSGSGSGGGSSGGSSGGGGGGSGGGAF